MNLDFLDDLVAYASTASIVIKAAMKALLSLVTLFPIVATFIRENVEKWFDVFDQKKAEGADDAVIETLKGVAEGDVIAKTMEEFHGSGSLISRGIIKAIIALFVRVIKAKRYGEDIERNEKAALKGYMSSSEDVRNAERTHPAFKLFGV